MRARRVTNLYRSPILILFCQNNDFHDHAVLLLVHLSQAEVVAFVGGSQPERLAKTNVPTVSAKLMDDSVSARVFS